MNRITSFLSATLIAVSLTSCGQSASTQQSRKVANNFAADPVPKDLSRYSEATFAAGCFWHEETLFESIKGVVDGVSGYAGGTLAHPSYEDVETGNTGHAETVNVYYDSTKISYPELLKVYFESQEDPTQINGQGPDEGTQYRSIIFYRNVQEKTIAENYINKLNKSGKYNQPIAAEVMPYTIFWKAEDYHQHYIDHNTDNPYVQQVSIRDIARFQEQHPEMIKPGHSFAGK
jgi:peptide-methionine (S)-S-oxide reductase